MIRIRTLLVTVLPSMVAGGFLFASAFGHAETGRDVGLWPASADSATTRPARHGDGRVVVAQADPWAGSRRGRVPVPPAPPAPPAPAPPAYATPVPPVAPLPPRGRHHNRGVQVTFHDGKLQLDGLAEMIEGQLSGVSAMLDALPDVPPEVRERVRERVKAVRRTVNGRLGKLRNLDVNQIGPEMERMGDEIEKEMEGLDKDLEKLGDKVGKHIAAELGQQLAKSFSHDDNDSDDNDNSDDSDDDDDVTPPSADPGDLAPQIAALKSLTLKPGQKDALARLRTSSEEQIRAAKQALDEASSRLHDTLGDSDANEGEIERQIDLVSRQEAALRKARILTWVKARKLLDKDQRKQVEAATKHHR